MDDVRLVALFSDEEIRSIAGHHRLHEMGLCTCPCDAAIFKLAAALPARDAAIAAMAMVAVAEVVADKLDNNEL